MKHQSKLSARSRIQIESVLLKSGFILKGHYSSFVCLFIANDLPYQDIYQQINVILNANNQGHVSIVL